MSRVMSFAPWVAAVVGFVIAVTSLLGGAIPLVFITGNFAAYAVAMCAVAAALAGWLGHTRALLAALGVGLVNAAIVLPAYLGPPAPEAGANVTKLLLFNTHWNNARQADVVTLIKERDPDVIVLLETFAMNRDGLRELDGLYPYRLECWRTLPCDTLVLSRKQLHDPFVTTEWNGAKLGIARVEFDVGSCPVTMFAAHLTRPWPYRRLSSDAAQYKQAAAFAQMIREWSGTKIVVGDFNAATWTHIVKSFAEAAQGQALAGASGTWPSYLPGFLKMPIDHVIVSRPQIRATREVLDPTGSDHSPVLVTMSAECGR